VTGPAGAQPPLFVYGTLMFPEVLDVLLGRTPDMAPASLPGWRAAALADRVYPGLVAAPGEVTGQLLLGLDAHEMDVLDAFEDVLYERRLLDLADADATTGARQAMTYVWLDATQVLPHDWDAAHFVTTELPAYIARWSHWRQSL
jgi:gamma-glutamylcyclotransferase (GGCT)/AIG2-like uncharacterized protein YtfP